MKLSFLNENIIEETKFKLIDTNDRGLGIVSTSKIPKGTEIGIAMNVMGSGESDVERTDLGKYVNHSDNPNSKYVRIVGDIILIALYTINSGEEILAPYEPNFQEIGYMDIEIPGDVDSIKEKLANDCVRINVPNSNTFISGAVYKTQWGEKIRILTSKGSIELIGFKRPEKEIGNYETELGNVWRAETGIELVSPHASPEENERRAHNWELMPLEAQQESDKKSIELYGKKNMDVIADQKSKLIRSGLDNVAESENLPTTCICEDVSYYEVRNFILYLLRKVRKNSTKEVLQDVYDALSHYEVTGAPYVKIATLRTPSPPLIKK